MIVFNSLKPNLIDIQSIGRITNSLLVSKYSEINGKMFITFSEKKEKIFNFSEKIVIEFDIMREKVGD